MQQILFRVPWIHIPIFGFGAMLFVAYLTCTWLAARRGRRVGVGPEQIQDLSIWLFVSGLLGARIMFLMLVIRPNNVADFFWQLPRIWDGGIILYGSIAGGIIGYVGFYLVSFRRYGIPTLRLADVVAPSVALGIAFGRIGCFLNGCCYGQVACADCAVYPVHFPMSAPPRFELTHAGYQTAAGFTYGEEENDKFVRVGRVEPRSPAAESGLQPGDLIEEVDGISLASEPGVSPKDQLSRHLGVGWERGQNQLTLTVRHTSEDAPRTLTFSPRTIGLLPTQLFETVSMVLLVLVLLSLDALPHPEGMLTAVLMMGYAAHRALNELLRNDPRPIGSERYSSYFLFAAGLALAVYVLTRRTQVKNEAPAPPRVGSGIKTAGAIARP